MKADVTFVTCQRNHQLLLLSITLDTHRYIYREGNIRTCEHKSSIICSVYFPWQYFSLSLSLTLDVWFVITAFVVVVFPHCYDSINKYYDKSVEWVCTHKPSHGAFVIEFCARCCSSTHHDTCGRAIRKLRKLNNKHLIYNEQIEKKRSPCTLNTVYIDLSRYARMWGVSVRRMHTCMANNCWNMGSTFCVLIHTASMRSI